MIKLPGVLNIRIITGRHGDFRVGRLVTELGEFSVKDAELDQYEEGKYEGEFGISQISPSYYQAGGRLVVEVKASLGFISLNRESTLEPVAETSMEQDPIEEDKTRAKPPHADPVGVEPEQGNGAPVPKPEPSETEPDAADAELFGLLWPISDSVKLDPTVDRALFRTQRDRLKALGYQFKPLSQAWVKG